MENSVYVSLSLAKSLVRSLDVAANNMANVNTTGFKAQRNDFQSLVENNLGGGGGGPGSSVSFVLNKGSYLDQSQGQLLKTGNPLDMALSGKGWFGYRTATGQTAFGRDGRFTIDAQGNLVTLKGAQVLDSSGAPIAIPAGVGNRFTVARDGTITGPKGQQLGQVGIFAVPGINGYQRIGDGMMIAPGGAQPSLTPESAPRLSQGFLEQSNVQPVLEMTRMMEIQRAYDRAMKLMDEQNSLRQQTLGQLGKV